MRNECEIWSLSPDSGVFQNFLKSIGGLVPGAGQTKARLPGPTPNEAAVALWIKVQDIAVLLGADLEKWGWTVILRSKERPAGTASAFKVPHHGSANADEREVWTRMLESAPFAVLAPWRRGGRALPGENDVRRILSRTGNAYATAKDSRHAPRRRERMVERSIRESGLELRELAMSPGRLRLRRPLHPKAQWTVERFGIACHLKDFAAS